MVVPIIIPIFVLLTNTKNDMELIGEFTINSIGDEIEDIVQYDEVSEDVLRKFVQKLIDDDTIVIGEKTEGSIEMDDTNIKLEYKWCSEVGEDWDSDVWEDEVLTLNRVDYEL